MTNGRDRRVFKEIHYPALAFGPHPVHAAGPEKKAVGMVTDADVERDGSLHRFDDVSEGHLAGGSAEHIAPSGPPSRSHQPLVDQLLDDLLEELPGDTFTCGDLSQR